MNGVTPYIEVSPAGGSLRTGQRPHQPLLGAGTAGTVKLAARNRVEVAAWALAVRVRTARRVRYRPAVLQSDAAMAETADEGAPGVGPNVSQSGVGAVARPDRRLSCRWSRRLPVRQASCATWSGERASKTSLRTERCAS